MPILGTVSQMTDREKGVGPQLPERPEGCFAQLGSDPILAANRLARQCPANDVDVTAICALVRDLCGIELDESKGYLVESRLGHLLQQHGCQTYAELAARARAGSAALSREIVDRITTGETLFFRDNAPYDALRHKVVPNVIDAREGSLYPRRIRVWSAGCSTGQEPYSIAMVLAELIPDFADWNISILATDVSDNAIRQASTGIFPAHHIERGLPDRLRSKYFCQRGQEWQVCDEIRSLIRFQRANLLAPFRALGEFDIIFCRNVAIYFSRPHRIDLFTRFADSLVRDGYLFVGSAEPLSDLKHRFTPEQHCRATVYRPL